MNQSPQLKDFIEAVDKDFEVSNDVFIIKTHHFKNIRKYVTPNSFTIFMLRDFNECVPSHCIQKDDMRYRKYIDEYCDQVLEYCEWGSNKHIVYYEDFIEDPVHEVGVIIDIFDDSLKSMLAKLEQNITAINSESLALKKSLKNPSLSGGNKKKFHSKKMNNEVLEDVNRIVKERLQDSQAFSLVSRYFE